jgi:hypothetical protein
MAEGLYIVGDCIELNGETVARLKPNLFPGTKIELQEAFEAYNSIDNKPDTNYVLNAAREKSQAGLITLAELESLLEK